jgi:hypothetical protein
MDSGIAQRRVQLYTRAMADARSGYDSKRRLIGQQGAEPGTTAYRPAGSLPFAHSLLREGDVAEAAAIVAAVIDSQVLDEGDPHRGNFLWLADDPEVADLNAVQFVLRGLLPLLLEQGERLPSGLLERCRVVVRAALEEEERMNVAPTYTNIHLMSLFALVVGGEWLGDERFAALGRERWQRWVDFTAASGAPHEFNSPSYGGINLSALAAIQMYARDALVRLQARLMYERLWLHVALHLHVPTGQVAGPHCRCYWDAMTTGRSSQKAILWLLTGWPWLDEPGPWLELALTDHWLPEAARDWLERHPTTAEVRETANPEVGQHLTTYLTPTYALGTASSTYGIGQDDFYIEHQANYLLLHYVRPDGFGMVYSRYVVNDRHRGRLGAAPDRPKTMNFYDQGHFGGAQLRNRAIALYALMPQHDEVSSLKTVVAFPGIVDELWIEGARVEVAELPRTLADGQWLVVVDGSVYVGVRPLEPSRLGRDAPILLERGPEGELWLTIYNYRGAPKRFWDYASLGGAFWRGNVRVGYLLEVAARDEYLNAAAFLDHLRQAPVSDQMDGSHVRTVRFGELDLRFDLWHTRPIERLIAGAPYPAPMLDSPVAAQGDGGRLELGDAMLETAAGVPTWLIARDDTWTAVVPGRRRTRLRLTTPVGEAVAEAFGPGRIEVQPDRVLLECLDGPSGLSLPQGARLEA